MNERYEFYIECECGCGILKADYFEPDWISLSYYVPQSSALTFWDRVKIAWKILNNRTSILFDLVLENKKFYEFVDWLDNIKREQSESK